MADPDDPTYDPPDQTITRADDKAQAARDAENHEGGRNDQWPILVGRGHTTLINLTYVTI